MSFLRNELSLNNVLLHHENLREFACFETKRVRHYKIWRILWAVYHVIWVALTGLISHFTGDENSAQHVKWFIYLTNWSYLTLTLTTLFDLMSVCRILRLPETNPHSPSSSSDKAENCHESSLPWVTKLTWICFNVSNVTAIAVTSLYWGFEYKESQPLTVVSIATHVLNSIYVIVNVLASSMPVKILHVIHPVLFSVTYVIFTCIYQLCGGENNRDEPYVYEMLDWTKPKQSLLYASVVTFAGIPLCHFVIYGTFISKRTISKFCSWRRRLETKECQIEGLLHAEHKDLCEEKEL